MRNKTQWDCSTQNDKHLIAFDLSFLLLKPTRGRPGVGPWQTPCPETICTYLADGVSRSVAEMLGGPHKSMLECKIRLHYLGVRLHEKNNNVPHGEILGYWGTWLKISLYSVSIIQKMLGKKYLHFIKFFLFIVFALWINKDQISAHSGEKNTGIKTT